MPKYLISASYSAEGLKVFKGTRHPAAERRLLRPSRASGARSSACTMPSAKTTPM